MNLENTKKRWQLLAMILIISIVLQATHPIVGLAARSLEELSFGVNNLTITLLNPKGEVFPYAEIELLKSSEYGYERVGDRTIKTDENGIANFEGMSFESTIPYGVIIKGYVQNPLNENEEILAVLFKELTPDIYNPTITLENDTFHRLDIQPYIDDDIMPYGDLKYFTIFAEDSMGEIYSTVINTFELNKSILLMEGSYSIQMCANHYLGMMSNYFFTKEINLTSDDEIVMGDDGYSNIKFLLPNESYKIDAISIYPNDTFKSSILYSV